MTFNALFFSDYIFFLKEKNISNTMNTALRIVMCIAVVYHIVRMNRFAAVHPLLLSITKVIWLENIQALTAVLALLGTHQHAPAGI